jgi:hypothetical protein
MKLNNLYFKSFLVTLILIFIGTAIISPQLGLAQDSQINPEQTTVPTEDDEGTAFPSQLPNFDPDRTDLPANMIILEGGDAERDMLGGSRAPGVLVIPSADFRSDGISPTSYIFSFSEGYFRGGASNSCLMAPAYLPQGVAINQIWATVMDNATNQYVWVGLFRLDNLNGFVTQITEFYTTNTHQSQSLQSIGSINLNTLVDYPTYSYYVAACLTGSSTRLYAVRIYYDL